MRKIELIDVKKITPHPQNLRKELGDLTELAESIKANGIFQNLTVVPWDERIAGKKTDEETEYITVIGHRRLAAAKLAGLMEVPCIVAEMNFKEQLATMLTENMQRSDLTILEQAEGFQLMLDFGETVDSIAGKTGFSETTVRRRVKLLDLDRDKFKESIERGATLQDYIELEKIKDEKLKNKVLSDIGTNNFQWSLNNAITTEKRAENKAILIAELDKFAIPVENGAGLRYVNWISLDRSDFERPEDAGEEKYYYSISSTYIKLYKDEPKETAANQEKDREREEMNERRSKLAEISKTAYQLRYQFVKGFTAVKKYAKEIMQFAARSMSEESHTDPNEIAKMLEVELSDGNECYFNDFTDTYSQSPERFLLIAAYCLMGDGESAKYYNWSLDHSENAELDNLYAALEKLGYEMSDEEKALQNGTHELFREVTE